MNTCIDRVLRIFGFVAAAIAAWWLSAAFFLAGSLFVTGDWAGHEIQFAIRQATVPFILGALLLHRCPPTGLMRPMDDER